MTAIEAIEKLQKLADSKDNEVVHAKADDILVEFLKAHDQACADVAKAYEELGEKVSFWYA